MAREVDRLLACMNRLEELQAEIAAAEPADRWLFRGCLEPAKRAEESAFAALADAARRGDPEAIVALDALEAEKKVAWRKSRSAA